MKKYRKNYAIIWITILLCIISVVIFYVITIRVVHNVKGKQTRPDYPGALSAEQEITMHGDLSDIEEKYAEIYRDRILEMLEIAPEAAENIGVAFVRVSRLYQSDSMPKIASITEEVSTIEHTTKYQLVDCDRHVFYFYIQSLRVVSVITEDSSQIYFAPLPA